MYGLHTVIIKNMPLDDAIEEAKKFIKTKSKKFYRETKSGSIRFRNIPKTKFKPKSFRTKKINKNISLVYGDLKDEFKHLQGGAWYDIFKNPIDTIKNAFSPISKLNNVSTDTLKTYGQNNIMSLKIGRTPLNPALTGAINTISLGVFNSLKSKYGIDKLFHLFLIANVGTDVILEKNEVINISTKIDSVNNKTEFMNVDLKGRQINLNDFVLNTQKGMGERAFYDYSAFSNNCQNFVQSMLKYNNLDTPQYEQFLLQNTSGFQKELPSYAVNVVNKITDLGSIVSRLLGKGKKNKNDALKAFDEYVNHYNLDTSTDDLATQHFIHFINTKGIKFI